MKIFKVSVDNNPGGWKQGEDPYLLVIAENKKEAINKVKNGWGDKWEYDHKTYDTPIMTYLQNPPDKGYNIVREDSQFSVTEIKFEGYDVHIKDPRKAKLDRLEKHIKREEDIENRLLNMSGTVLRKLMSSEEIKVANRLVRENKLQKGYSDDKQKSVIFYNN